MQRKQLKDLLTQHPELDDLSGGDVARFLLERYDLEESFEAIKRQCNRIRATGWEPNRKPVIHSSVRELQEDYFYNEVKDEYIIFNGPAKGTISGRFVKALQERYSNGGLGSTVNELSLEYGVTPSFIKGLFRVLNITHASLPFTNEEIAASIDDEEKELELRQQATMLQAQKLNRAITNDRLRKMQADAHQWNEFEAGQLKPLLKFVEENPPRRRVFQVAGQPEEFDVLFNASDVHIGALGIYGEGLEETHASLMQTTETLIARVAKKGRPRRVVVVLNGDWFHADTPKGTTTRGTPLDMACSPDVAFNVGCDIAIEYIDRLRSLGPTTVYVVRGNHDNNMSLALNRVLIEAYKSIDGIDVVEASCEPWYMMLLGKAHLYFEHGDGPKGAKITPIMAKKGKEMWYRANHHYAFTGHLHHLKVLDQYGVVHLQMSSLARADRFHAKGGWINATRMQEAYCFDADGFLCDVPRAFGG